MVWRWAGGLVNIAGPQTALSFSDPYSIASGRTPTIRNDCGALRHGSKKRRRPHRLRNATAAAKENQYRYDLDHVPHIHLSRNARVIPCDATNLWFEMPTLRRRDYEWMLWRRETPTNVTRKAWGPAAADTTSLIGKARIAETLGEGGEVLLPTKLNLSDWWRANRDHIRVPVIWLVCARSSRPASALLAAEMRMWPAGKSD